MTIITGDCLEIMRTFPDNHFTGIVTDSPYGISFMGKGWDKGIPSIEYWQEMLRIVKPGGHLISAGLPRMMHRLISVIEDAGWEIRDLLMHLFGSGFPKSHNHFGAEGYGTALKPAWEGWSLAMKPLDGTFKQNYEKWGVGGLNIDGCRVGTDITTTNIKDLSQAHGNNFGKSGIIYPKIGEKKNLPGRWPANLILDEESGQLLDRQSGFSDSSAQERKNGEFRSVAKGKDYPHSTFGYSDSGGASRFFYCPKASSRERNEGIEALPVKSISGCYGKFEGDGRGRQTEHQPANNHHPTVKPLSLMRYLITLISPPTNALILDPFAGSGSTIVASTHLGIGAIGIEKDPEYADIARARVEHTERIQANSKDSQLEMEI